MLSASHASVIQAKAAAGGEAATSSASSAANTTKIPAPVRAKMETAFGADYSNVRVHPSSPRAAALGALAFTQGSDIHFAPGQWSPETTRGQEVLGHELWHLEQRHQGRVRATTQYKGVGLNDDAGLEAEADAMGALAARAPSSSVTAVGHASAQRSAGSPAPGPIQRMRDDHEYEPWDARQDMDDFDAWEVEEELPEQRHEEDEEPRIEIEAEGNARSLLQRFAPLLRRVAPATGDTGEIVATLKVPVDPSGIGYLGFRFKAEVERRFDGYKVRFETVLTSGAKVGNIGELGGELGGYLEATGATPDDAMALISYGVYRRFRESVWLPRELANYGWGGGEGWKGAEAWAADVEREKLGSKGSYVETGGLAVAKGDFGIAKVAKAKLEGKLSSGRKYDKASIEKYKRAGFGEPSAKPERRSTEVIGASVQAVKTKGNVTVGPFRGEVSAGFKFVKERGMPAQLISFDVGGSVTGTLDKAISPSIGDFLKPIGERVAAAIEKAFRAAQERKRIEEQVSSGAVVSTIEESAQAFAALGHPLVQSEITRGFPPMLGNVADVSISILGIVKLAPGADPKPRLEIKLTQSEAVALDVGAFTAKGKRGHRLLMLTHEDGSWRAE
ncbi:hypothetical protein A7982_13737 [Minicystis rosea]|nr:hypothetical protein A7982_13737 [Minicystis rosea]